MSHFLKQIKIDKLQVTFSKHISKNVMHLIKKEKGSSNKLSLSK